MNGPTIDTLESSMLQNKNVCLLGIISAIHLKVAVSNHVEDFLRSKQNSKQVVDSESFFVNHQGLKDTIEKPEIIKASTNSKSTRFITLNKRSSKLAKLSVYDLLELKKEEDESRHTHSDGSHLVHFLTAMNSLRRTKFKMPYGLMRYISWDFGCSKNKLKKCNYFNNL